MSSSQVGKTEVLLNVIGFHIHHDPAPMLVLQPTTQPMAQDFSKDRLATMLRDSPVLSEKISKVKGRDSGNTILHKTFVGGHVTIGGANSPSGLASRPIRITLADEIDRYPASAGSEGDPLSLVERRSTTFWNRKRVRTSTPTVQGMSRIEDAFLEGDQRRYYVPCPHCDVKQVLVWSNVKWDRLENGDPDLDTVHYECAHCRDPIEHIEKRAMLLAGEWQAQAPFAGHASFHINALYSPWTTWREIVEEWQLARGDSERMKVWTNTLLGETFREEAKEIEHAPLMAKREAYSVPNSVLVTIATVDVQEDRLELLLVGYGVNESAWHLGHKVFYGDTTQKDVWKDLEDYITHTRVKRDDGAVFGINAVGIDSGYQTNMVYSFVAATRHGRVFTLKGMAGERAIVTSPKGKVRVFTVGVDPAKDIIFQRAMLKDDAPGQMHFNMHCDEEYFLQLTAEKAVIKKRRGFEVREWQKVRPRNEILDLWVYALATLYILAPQWEALDKTNEEKPQPAADQNFEAIRRRPMRRRGGFVQKW